MQSFGSGMASGMSSGMASAKMGMDIYNDAVDRKKQDEDEQAVKDWSAKAHKLLIADPETVNQDSPVKQGVAPAAPSVPVMSAGDVTAPQPAPDAVPTAAPAVTPQATPQAATPVVAPQPASTAAPQTAPTSSTWTPGSPVRTQGDIAQAAAYHANRTGIPVNDVLRQINAESAFNPNIVSPKGAQGLMQIMPATARDPGYGVTPLRNNSPEENIRFGTDYQAALLRQNGGNRALAYAAYNAGQGAVDKAGGVPNIPETRNYVAKLAGPATGIDTRMAGDSRNAGMPVPAQRLPMTDGATPPPPERAFTKHSAQDLADLYQEGVLASAGNRYANTLAPSLELIRNRGMALHMDEFKGDPTTHEGLMDYMRHWGKGTAMFGEPMSPSDIANLTHAANAESRAEDEHGWKRSELVSSETRADNQDRRAEQSSQMAKETHDAQMKDRQRELDNAAVDDRNKTYQNLYDLIQKRNYPEAQKIASKLGVEVGDFTEKPYKMPNGTDTTAMYFTIKNPNGSTQEMNTADAAADLGRLEQIQQQQKAVLKANTGTGRGTWMKTKDADGNEVSVYGHLGPDGQPVVEAVPVRGLKTAADQQKEYEDARKAKASGGHWYDFMTGASTPEKAKPSQSPVAAGIAPTDQSAETPAQAPAAPAAPAAKAAAIPAGGGISDPARGIVDADGKVLVPNGTVKRGKRGEVATLVNGRWVISK